MTVSWLMSSEPGIQDELSRSTPLSPPSDSIPQHSQLLQYQQLEAASLLPLANKAETAGKPGNV